MTRSPTSSENHCPLPSHSSPVAKDPVTPHSAAILVSAPTEPGCTTPVPQLQLRQSRLERIFEEVMCCAPVGRMHNLRQYRHCGALCRISSSIHTGSQPRRIRISKRIASDISEGIDASSKPDRNRRQVSFRTRVIEPLIVVYLRMEPNGYNRLLRASGRNISAATPLSLRHQTTIPFTESPEYPELAILDPQRPEQASGLAWHAPRSSQHPTHRFCIH